MGSNLLRAVRTITDEVTAEVSRNLARQVERLAGEIAASALLEQAGDDPRDLVFSVRYRDGREERSPLELPVLWPRGKWSEDATYKRLEIVTWNGSAWVATRAHAGAEPGRSDAWLLLVKQGDRGRSGRAAAIDDLMPELIARIDRAIETRLATLYAAPPPPPPPEPTDDQDDDDQDDGDQDDGDQDDDDNRDAGDDNRDADPAKAAA